MFRKTRHLHSFAFAGALPAAVIAWPGVAKAKDDGYETIFADCPRPDRRFIEFGGNLSTAGPPSAIKCRDFDGGWLLVALVSTVAYLGLEARAVEVQCQIAPGMPGFALVGLPDKAVGESRQRVQAALSAMGLSLPPKRITINLSPADLPKEGSHYDLPIALALLAAMGVADAEVLADHVAVGELALDGRIIPSPGVLLAAIHASGLDKGLICPAAQGSEARWASGIPILAAPDLVSLLNHLKGTQVLAVPPPGEAAPPVRGPDLAQVKGQEVAKRALEIAAAGGHNLIMVGPPGAGKSLLASCLPGILPELTPAEALGIM